MSDLATQHDDGALEPDEETLISALRNQDDIPILMDIVADQLTACVSQEEYFLQSIDDSHEGVETLKTDVPSLSYSQDSIAQAITAVLERRLPELVAEVMQALNADQTSGKKE